MDVYFEQYKPASSIANYLAIGCKSQEVQTLGFELEHFVVKKDGFVAVPFCVSADSEEPSVEKVLERIKGYYFEALYEEDNEGTTRLFGLGREKAAITLEPGAQLEISIGPAHSLSEIEELYQVFRREIDPVLDEMGLQLLELGYHPTSQACEIPLLPKPRYHYMDAHFAQTGKHGICMMRATASTQVSIDYSSQDDAIAKFRIANALGPLFAFITDNSPVFEAEVVGAQGGTTVSAGSGLAVPERMARMVCWDDTDPKRCLTTKGCFDDDFSFLRYAEALIESPAVFLPAQGKGEDAKSEFLGFTTFKQVLPDAFIDEALVLHILSLFFFDARLKTYLELRQADSLPLEYALAYTALVSGLFYNPKALEYYAECFVYVDATSIAFAKSSLRGKGYDATVYGRSASEWLDEMMSLALEGLSAEDAPYLAPLAKLVKQRMTLLEPAH